MDQQPAPKAFISYSHDSPEHKADVLALANRLCNEGIDCEIDQYLNGAPLKGWIRWMEQQIESADFVLVVCTEIYLKRFKGDDRLGGRGVNFEGLLISQTLYDQFLENTKFLPLIPENGSIDHVPLILKGGTTYKVHSDYEKLYRVLTKQPESVKPSIGPRVLLNPAKGHALNDRIAVKDTQTRVTEQPINGGELQSSQKLINSLAKQLQRPDLQMLIADYVERINENFNTSFANNQANDKAFASYLANQADDEQRRLQVLHLLDAIQDKSNIQDAEELLAFLLQTLVRKDEINADRLNRVPFTYSPTLDLLTASRHNQALIPDYAHAEFSNGQQKSDIYEYSHYQPLTGTWDKERECREIARDLLRKLGDPDADSDNTLSLLLGRLRRYDTSPQNRPVKGIRIHQRYLDKHPFSNADVAEYFLKIIGRYVPVFVYGDATAGDELDYLYVSEDDIRGMLIDQVATHSSSPKSKPTMQQETSMSNQPNPITVTVVTNSPGTVIGDNNTQIIDNSTKQALSDELARLKTDADQDDSIGKKQYAEIVAATDMLSTEIAKPQADKTALTKAKEVLEGFKNIASIAGSIEKISQFLIPLIS